MDASNNAAPLPVLSSRVMQNPADVISPNKRVVEQRNITPTKIRSRGSTPTGPYVPLVDVVRAEFGGLRITDADVNAKGTCLLVLIHGLCTLTS